MTRYRLKPLGVKLSLPIITTIFLSAPYQALSEESELLSLSLEELLQIEVEVAGKKAQPLKYIPQTVHIVTRQQIKEKGYRNIMEALADKPGFQLQKNWYLDRLVVRGQKLSLNKLLLLVDGQAMTMKSDNYNILNGAAPVDMQDIETIEVLIGPSSALYGSGAFVGVVNIKTRKASNGLTFNAYAATPNERGVHLYYGANLRGYAVGLSISDRQSKGEELPLLFPGGAPPEYTQTSITADGYNTLDATRVAVKLEGDGLEARMQYSNASIGWPTSLFGTDINNHGNRYDIEHKSLQLKYHQSYTRGLNATTRAYYVDSRGFWKGIYNGELYLAPDGEEYSGKYYGLEYKLDYQASDIVSIVSGVEYTQNSDIRSIDYVDDFDNMSLFGVVELQTLKSLELELGARVENYSYNNDYELMPQLGMAYKVSAKSHLKFSYSRGYIAPSTWVRQVTETVAGDTPKPEKLDSLELSFYQQFKHLATTVTLYQAKQTDNIVAYYDGNTPSSISNSRDRETYQGLELANDFRVSETTSVLVNVSYVDAFAEPSEGANYELTGIADTTISSSLRTVLLNKNILTLQHNYVSHIQGYPRIKAWNRFDLSFFNNDVFGTELTIKLANIFDRSMTTYDDASEALKVADRGRHLLLSISGKY